MSAGTRSRVRQPGGGLYRLKSDRQVQCDRYGQALSARWPTQIRGFAPTGITRRRVHGHRRVVENEISTVLHCLMHIPAFVNWIRNHGHYHTAGQNLFLNGCEICTLAAFVDRYWFQTNPPLRIRSNDTALRRFRVWQILDIPNHPGMRYDATNFYDLLTSRAILQQNIPLHINYPGHRWIAEMDALFELEIHRLERCPCGYSTVQVFNRMDAFPLPIMNVPAGPFAQLVQNQFNKFPVRNCPTCTMPTMTTCLKINAAPQILRFKILLMGLDNWQWKLSTPFNIPQILDMTTCQLIPDLPLTYSLSSVIAHGDNPIAPFPNIVNPASAQLFNQCVANVRGYQQDYHVCERHHVPLTGLPSTLNDNPQTVPVPWHPNPFVCRERIHGNYIPYILTFTRDKLRGADRKREIAYQGF